MEDPPLAVTPFPGQVEGISAGREFYPPVDQFLNGWRAFFYNHSDYVFMADPGTGNKRIINMGSKGVFLRKDGSNAALGIICR
jgi:hypothetical protein